MSAQARRVFREIADALGQRGDLFAEDRYEVVGYAECVAEAIASLRAARKARTVKGYNGQDVAHPGFGEARAFMGVARSYAEALGLSPGARAKWAKKGAGGRPKGSASAPDRRRQQFTLVQGGES